jgi:hypothetical protein
MDVRAVKQPGLLQYIGRRKILRRPIFLAILNHAMAKNAPIETESLTFISHLDISNPATE